MSWFAVSVFACRSPEVEVVAVTDYGPLETPTGVQSRERGHSTGFGDRSVWVFGDTILTDGWRDNSMVWTTDLVAADGLAGFFGPIDHGELFTETPYEAAYNADHAGLDCAEAPCGAREVVWPQAVVTDPAGERMIVFTLKNHGEPDLRTLQSRGVGVATWTAVDQAPVRLETSGVRNDPTLLFGPQEPMFGDAAAIGPDGLLYVWGREEDDGRKREVLARVFPEDVGNRDLWIYWDGQDWSHTLGDAEPVFTGAAELSVHFDEALGTWLAAYVDGRHLVMRTAPEPEGPWSHPVKLVKVEDPWDGSAARGGMFHAEFAQDGVQFATYFRETGEWTGETRVLGVELRVR